MFLYSNWKSLPLHVRAILAQHFNIIKKHPTHVQDNVVVTDGYDLKDIEAALNIPALQHYTGFVDEKDPIVLWNAMVDKAEGRVTIVVKDDAPLTIISEPVEIKPITHEETKGKTSSKKQGRVGSRAKK